MKRSLSQADYRRAGMDLSHRRLADILKGPPKRPVTKQVTRAAWPKGKPAGITQFSPMELEQAKQQAAAYLKRA